MYMSGGQNYLLLAMDMAKVGGPLSAVKVCISIFLGIGKWVVPCRLWRFSRNLNIPSPLPSTFLGSFANFVGYSYIYIYIYICIWIKAIWGWFPLLTIISAFFVAGFGCDEIYRQGNSKATPPPVDPPGRRGFPCSPATSETRPRSPVKPTSPGAPEEFPPAMRTWDGRITGGEHVSNGKCISRSYYRKIIWEK